VKCICILSEKENVMTNTNNMQPQSSIAQSASPAKSVWVGRALSGIVVAFLLFDGILKLIPAQVVLDTIKQLGWPNDIETARLLGVLTLLSTLLYAIPRTSVLGAILLTGYLGGAIATHVRIGSPLFTHILFGAYIGIMLWGGLWLRDIRLRALFPVRSS
jgi:DoxX-like family